VKTTTPLLIALLGVSACAQAPTSPSVARAPSRIHELCATIAWQDRAPARDINSLVSTLKHEPELTRIAYEAERGPTAPGSVAIAELEQPFRSPQSINLALQLRREYDKTRTRGIEQWVQAHLAVEMRTCPVQ
jgi:hypothetical protein